MKLAQNRGFSSFIHHFLCARRTDKNSSKKAKKCFTHTLHRGPKYTGFFADFRDLYIFEKSLDFCDFLIYYSVRYSGIVQSVEQRTVNPYVTGSSPVARATFYTVLLKGGFSLDFQAFSEFDNVGCKTCYFSGIIELHNKKG